MFLYRLLCKKIAVTEAEIDFDALSTSKKIVKAAQKAGIRILQAEEAITLAGANILNKRSFDETQWVKGIVYGVTGNTVVQNIASHLKTFAAKYVKGVFPIWIKLPVDTLFNKVIRRKPKFVKDTEGKEKLNYGIVPFFLENKDEFDKLRYKVFIVPEVKKFYNGTIPKQKIEEILGNKWQDYFEEVEVERETLVPLLLPKTKPKKLLGLLINKAGKDLRLSPDKRDKLIAVFKSLGEYYHGQKDVYVPIQAFDGEKGKKLTEKLKIRADFTDAAGSERFISIFSEHCGIYHHNNFDIGKLNYDSEGNLLLTPEQKNALNDLIALHDKSSAAYFKRNMDAINLEEAKKAVAEEAEKNQILTGLNTQKSIDLDHREAELYKVGNWDLFPEEGVKRIKDGIYTFYDISGSTTASEKMDPEDFREFTGEILGHIERVVLQHNGIIDNLTGDGYFVNWYQTRRDKYAMTTEEKQILAILALLSIFRQKESVSIDPKIKEILEKYKEGDNATIKLHAGLDIGGAVARVIGKGSQRYTLTGLKVNHAAKIQAVATDDEILISNSMAEKLSKCTITAEMKYLINILTQEPAYALERELIKEVIDNDESLTFEEFLIRSYQEWYKRGSNKIMQALAEGITLTDIITPIPGGIQGPKRTLYVSAVNWDRKKPLVIENKVSLLAQRFETKQVGAEEFRDDLFLIMDEIRTDPLSRKVVAQILNEHSISLDMGKYYALEDAFENLKRKNAEKIEAKLREMRIKLFASKKPSSAEILAYLKKEQVRVILRETADGQGDTHVLLSYQDQELMIKIPTPVWLNLKAEFEVKK